MAELKVGEMVPLEDGGSAQIIEEIGSGGQGTVYKVAHEGREFALKWYRPSKVAHRDAFRKNLEQNIFEGAPTPRFLWPLELTKEYKDTFGYVMDLRPQEYVDLASILNCRQAFSGLHAPILAALNIVDSFRSLHRKGKCYQDMNDGSFFINTATGDVLICDNDNITPDKTNIGMAGMPGYMAPEIVRGEATPETQTDYHSLAVILFKLLVRHDPFMGKAFVSHVCITEEAEKNLYGVKPVFIFDHGDPSNRPIPHVHPNPLKLWPIYPEYIQNAFSRTFGDGVKHPGHRLSDDEWRHALIRLRGEILSCYCGHEFFASSVAGKVKDGAFACPACGAACRFPLKLTAKNMPVYMFPGSSIFKCHISLDSDDYATEAGRVMRHKKEPSIWAIRNMTDKPWFQRYEAEQRKVEPGSVTIIREGMILDFGQVSGVIGK